MKLLSIANGQLTIQLSTHQCAGAAQACWFAGEHTCDDEGELWRALAGHFQASALAGYACWQLDGEEAAALEEQLHLAGLKTLMQQWELELVQASPFLQGLLKDRYRQGQRQATLEVMREVLTKRFGQGYGQALGLRLEPFGEAVLKRLYAIALTAPTPAAFEAALAEPG